MTFSFDPSHLDREFPVRRNLLYFNHAAVSPLPRRVADAITAHVANARERGAADWRKWFATIERTRGKAARLVAAKPAEIAILPSTSWALNVVARSFRWRRGDNVVGDDMEFPSNSLPWRLLEDEGIEYRAARNREGRIALEDLAPLVDLRTRVVAVSWVAFHNGWVYPIDEIGRFCRDRGILFVVDAIQGLGALPLDVSETAVDVLAADSHKWLLGTEGCTIAYVREDVRDMLPPRFGGWWNTRAEESGAGFLSEKLDFYSTARRYEPGTVPTAQVSGLEAALDLLAEMTPGTVRSRILELVGSLRDGLAARGWRIATPEPLGSGILAAAPPKGDARETAKALEARGIIVAPREGAVRFSPHAGNDLGQVERLLAAIDAIG
jgi:cysteine desulfurase / selenocysteine lyase